ncbi:MAG: bZIP transcription factor [Lentisphaeria bacterium]
MGSLGKVFGPIVVVLAIAAAVLSFILSGQRMKFRERAASLAQGMAETAQKLDEGSNSGASAELTFTPASESAPKEGGSLGWEAYKAAEKAQNGAYKKTIDDLVSLAEQVVRQRNGLSASLLETAAILGYPAEITPPAAELQSLEKFATGSALLVAHASVLAERDLAILRNINEIAALVQSSVPETVLTRPLNTDADGNVTAGEYGVDSAFDSLKKSVLGYQERCEMLSKGIAGAVKIINKYPKWSVRPANLNKNNSKTLLDEMIRLAADCKGINEELIRKEFLEKEYEKQKETIEALENSNQELEEKNTSLQANLRKMKQQLSAFVGFSDEGASGSAVASMEEVPTDRNGAILHVDKDYGFAVVDFTEREVMPGVKLAVLRKGEYLATLQVLKVTPHQSIADILLGNISDLVVGDTVIVSAMHIQGLDKKDESPGKSFSAPAKKDSGSAEESSEE